MSRLAGMRETRWCLRRESIRIELSENTVADAVSGAHALILEDTIANITDRIKVICEDVEPGHGSEAIECSELAEFDKMEG